MRYSNTTGGMFKLLERLNRLYSMVRGKSADDQIGTKETVTFFLKKEVDE
jgi:hypothetical protein